MLGVVVQDRVDPRHRLYRQLPGEQGVEAGYLPSVRQILSALISGTDDGGLEYIGIFVNLDGVVAGIAVAELELDAVQGFATPIPLADVAHGCSGVQLYLRRPL